MELDRCAQITASQEPRQRRDWITAVAGVFPCHPRSWLATALHWPLNGTRTEAGSTQNLQTSHRNHDHPGLAYLHYTQVRKAWKSSDRGRSWARPTIVDKRICPLDEGRRQQQVSRPDRARSLAGAAQAHGSLQIERVNQDHASANAKKRRFQMQACSMAHRHGIGNDPITQ